MIYLILFGSPIVLMVVFSDLIIITNSVYLYYYQNVSNTSCKKSDHLSIFVLVLSLVSFAFKLGLMLYQFFKPDDIRKNLKRLVNSCIFRSIYFINFPSLVFFIEIELYDT